MLEELGLTYNPNGYWETDGCILALVPNNGSYLAFDKRDWANPDRATVLLSEGNVRSLFAFNFPFIGGLR